MIDAAILVLLLVNAVVTTGLVINARAMAGAMEALLKALDKQ